MRALVLAAALAAVIAPGAHAAEICVDTTVPACDVTEPTLADAFETANADVDADRIHLGAGVHTGRFAAEAGHPVQILGAGPAATRIVAGAGTGPTLALGAGDLVSDVALEGAAPQAVVLELAGARARRIRLDVEDGTGVLARGAASSVNGAEVRLDGAGAAFTADCTVLLVRHATVVGTAADGVRADACPAVEPSWVVDSVFHGDFEPLDGNVAAMTSWFDEPVEGEGNLTGDGPGFVSASNLRLLPDSPLIDRGGDEPLANDEPQEDLEGYVRIADGDGDGLLERDLGAHERQPAALPLPEGNVLVNPGAEAGVEGWTPDGAFAATPFGTIDGGAPLPSLRAGEALGAGTRFFAGGVGALSRLTQRVGLTASAQQIDGGTATAALSGLLGGYRADEDRVTVDAVFLDPDATPISSLRIGPVTPAERGNATNLVVRSAAARIPPRTRAIDVVITAERVGSETEKYADGYADNLGLVLSVPSEPSGPIVPGDPIVNDLKPFSGVTVLTGQPWLRTDGTLRARVACASATVGRCTGEMALRGTVPGQKVSSRFARGRFSIAAGGRTTVTLKLTAAVRRALRRRTSFRARFVVEAVDGQARKRTTVVPVRVRAAKR